MLPKHMKKYLNSPTGVCFIYQINKDETIILYQQGYGNQAPSYPTDKSVTWNNFYRE